MQQKPVLSYWKSTDPCYKIPELTSKLTDITIIETKNLTEDFVKFCLMHKDRLFLHVVINGMGSTMFEPNIPSVKQMFERMVYLVQNGFDVNKILIVVKPILHNQNGLNALKLLLRVLTEFKFLRFRQVKFCLLPYYLDREKSNTYKIANRNISGRLHKTSVNTYKLNQYLIHTGSDFYKNYYKLLDDYKAIITIDNNTEALIGYRELKAFGLKTTWTDGSRLIEYENNDLQKPKVKVISPSNPHRCRNRCVLCPLKG